MVSKEEIEQLGKLMHIDIDDHIIHIDRIKKMIDYFSILDDADITSEDLILQELELSQLRKDEFQPFGEQLIKKLKNYKNSYIKAPKMS